MDQIDELFSRQSSVLGCERFGSERLGILMQQAQKSSSGTLLVMCTLSAAVLFGIPMATGAHLRAWDAPTHMFFASAYIEHWWNTWDPRWYGGYSLTHYPPLAHQLVALASRMSIARLNAGYGVVVYVFLLIGPFAAFKFARVFVDQTGGILAGLIFVLLPSLRITLFVHGQLAGYVSLVFSMLAISAADDFTRDKSTPNALILGGCTACAVAAHHATVTFFLVPVLCLFLIHRIASPTIGVSTKSAIRIFLPVIAVVAAGMVLAFPFILWMFNFDMQVPIPHASRLNFFHEPSVGRLFFVDYYGPILLVAPFLFLHSLAGRKYRLLTLAALVYMLLGLGGTTNLPNLLFGYQWEWLTYERFNLWATIVLLPLFAYCVGKGGFVHDVSKIVMLLLVLSSALWMIDPLRQTSTPAPLDITETVSLLGSKGDCFERYLALGFGYQLPELSTRTGARTLDGLWHTARSDELMRSSGIGALSDSIYWKDGERVLSRFLERTAPNPANCIFINDSAYSAWKFRKIVTQQGWTNSQLLDNSVSLWIRPDYPSIDSISRNEGLKQPQVAAWFWGLLPLCYLGIVLFAVIFKIRLMITPEHFGSLSRIALDLVRRI